MPGVPSRWEQLVRDERCAGLVETLLRLCPDLTPPALASALAPGYTFFYDMLVVRFGAHGTGTTRSTARGTDHSISPQLLPTPTPRPAHLCHYRPPSPTYSPDPPTRRLWWHTLVTPAPTRAMAVHPIAHGDPPKSPRSCSPALHASAGDGVPSHGGCGN